MSLDELSVKELLMAGVHFGHKVSRWNPKMKPYIYGKRNMVHLINVNETLKGLVRAFHVIKKLTMKGETVLWVGTKKQLKTIVETEANKAGTPYVSERWPGGLLTNFRTIRSRLNTLIDIETKEKDGILASYTKKEVSKIMRLKKKLIRNLGGIRTMDKYPACLLVIDPVSEHIAIDEANTIGAMVIALADTDADPDKVDLVIPCNDDSIKVVQLLLGKLSEAIIEGKAGRVGQEVAVPQPIN